MFDTLQDRLASTFKGLRGKGRLTDADIDATTRQIRIALLEADVNLSVVKEFVAAIKERCHGEELSKALNPTQQIVKIVNEELVEILGGQTRTVRFAKTPPTIVMLAGLQGAGRRPWLGSWLGGSRKRATPRCWPPATSSGPMPSLSCRWSENVPGCTSSLLNLATELGIPSR